MTATVLTHRGQLLRDYQPYDLHQLRVHIRRIRALMKHVPVLRNKALRSGWRELFVATNAARDWDVMLPGTREWLGEAGSKRFESALAGRVDRHRENATAMLRSARWRAHMTEWSQFIESHLETEWCIPDGLLPAMQARVRSALERAHISDDKQTWHRYRIEIKNLRYVATILQESGWRDPNLTGLIERCCAMQDLLGDWHDCSVQLKWLRSDEVSQDLDRLGDAEEIRRTLTQGIALKRARLMDAIRTSASVENPAHSRGAPA